MEHAEVAAGAGWAVPPSPPLAPGLCPVGAPHLNTPRRPVRRGDCGVGVYPVMVPLAATSRT